MLTADYFPSDFITLIDVFGEVGSECLNVARRLRQRGAEINEQAHFAPEGKAIRREACRF